MPDAPPLIRVLHLDDSHHDAEIVLDILQAGSLAYDVVHVDNRPRFEAALAERTFDLIVCDFNLPDIDGLTAMRLARVRFPDVPVIIVSGAIDPVEAVRCLQEGATDYVLKQRLERLPSALTRALEDAELRRQRERMHAQLLEAEERFRQLAEKSREGFWFVALNPERILYVNPAVETIWGVPAERFYQDPRVWLGAVHADDRAHVQEVWEAWAMDQAPLFEEECRIVRSDGVVRWVLNSGTRIRDDTGVIIRLSGLTQDITDRKELEAQIRQSQKMESVGQLAGGIAHDFNNLLTVINGMTDLALHGLADRDPLRADLEEVRKAGERAAALTRQLLAFSRKQILQPQVLNLATIVSNTESMLRRLIGADINLVIAQAERLECVKADAGQLEQVLVNLVVNARDAMPGGGTLTIDTTNVALDQDDDANMEIAVSPGPYVMLAVSDTGVGMDNVTRRRLFEPYYTTKGPDKGTGLGLSTVHGIIAQSGGSISVHSEVGRGTSFKIYLPRVAAAAGATPSTPTVTGPRSTETILLVEDNRALRGLARRILVSAGYTVLAAGSGQEALLALEHHETPVHLLLTDVVMPGMNGNELAQRCRERYSGLKVLYASGYTENATVLHGIRGQEISFIGKPFTVAELTRKVREVLDS